MLPFPFSLTRHANTGWKPMQDDEEAVAVYVPLDHCWLDSDGRLCWINPGTEPGFEWPTFLLVFSVSFVVMVAVALAMI